MANENSAYNIRKQALNSILHNFTAYN